jgi:hypothetical protein
MSAEELRERVWQIVLPTGRIAECDGLFPKGALRLRRQWLLEQGLAREQGGRIAYASMPCTAAACVMIVRMKDKSITSVADPAPCFARFRPNSISRSLLRADSFTLQRQS